MEKVLEQLDVFATKITKKLDSSENAELLTIVQNLKKIAANAKDSDISVDKLYEIKDDDMDTLLNEIDPSNIVKDESFNKLDKTIQDKISLAFENTIYKHNYPYQIKLWNNFRDRSNNKLKQDWNNFVSTRIEIQSLVKPYLTANLRGYFSLEPISGNTNNINNKNDNKFIMFGRLPTTHDLHDTPFEFKDCKAIMSPDLYNKQNAAAKTDKDKNRLILSQKFYLLYNGIYLLFDHFPFQSLMEMDENSDSIDEDKLKSDVKAHLVDQFALTRIWGLFKGYEQNLKNECIKKINENTQLVHKSIEYLINYCLTDVKTFKFDKASKDTKDNKKLLDELKCYVVNRVTLFLFYNFVLNINSKSKKIVQFFNNNGNNDYSEIKKDLTPLFHFIWDFSFVAACYARNGDEERYYISLFLLCFVFCFFFFFPEKYTSHNNNILARNFCVCFFHGKSQRH